MADAVRLDTLRAAVADKADIAIGASGRHTTALVNARINRSLKRWKEFMHRSGSRLYLKVASVQTSAGTTVDANGWAPNQYVVAPTDLEEIDEMDILDGNEPITMFEMQASERNDFEVESFVNLRDGLGRPIGYLLGGENEAGDDLIRVFPRADGVYTIRIRYRPTHVDLSDDADTFKFLGGGSEWVENDAALQSMQKDGLAGRPQYSELVRQNLEIERKAGLAAAVSAGPRRRQDTKGRRAYAIWRSGIDLG